MISLHLIAFLCLGLSAGISGEYSYVLDADTSNGYCEPEEDPRVKIPLVSELCMSEPCEIWRCEEGQLFVEGCEFFEAPEDPNCKYEKGEGVYPECCPSVNCVL